MTEKKIVFLAYLYPPAGGKGLPGVQRSVKFVRYLSRRKKVVLTLEPELYPVFFSTDNHMPLPVNHEEVVRIGTIDVFKAFLGFRGLLASLLGKKRGDHGAGAANQPGIPASAAHFGGKSAFTKAKDAVSGVLTFPDYAYAWLFPAVWRGRKLLNKSDVIFATGMPWTCLVAGWLLKMLTGAKLIVDFRDPWVNNPFAVDKSGPRKAAEAYVERKIVETADIVSLNTRELRADFVGRYPALPEEKFVTLVNGYDENDFQGVYKKKSENRNGRIVLTHGGLLYGLRDPKPIFQALARIREEHPDIAGKIRFTQMGDTRLNYDLEDLVAENELGNNYRDMGQIPYARCLQEMADSDILVIIQQDTKTQIPSKMYEYICLNKPILTIASKDGALGKMVGEYRFGEIFEPQDTEGLADYLCRQVREKAEHGEIRACYEHRETFDVRNIAKMLEEMTERLFSQTP